MPEANAGSPVDENLEATPKKLVTQMLPVESTATAVGPFMPPPV